MDLKALEAMGVHYWISNAHKWLLAARGAAVFWVAKPAQVSDLALVATRAFTSQCSLASTEQWRLAANKHMLASRCSS